MEEEEKRIGNLLFKDNQFEEAIKHYTKGIEYSKENAVLYANRALCYFKLLEYEKCISDCDTTLELDPKYTKALFRRGLSKFNLGKFQEAVEDFNKSLKQDSNKSSKTECELYIKYIQSFDFQAEKDIHVAIVHIEQQIITWHKDHKNYNLAIEHLDRIINKNIIPDVLWNLRAEILLTLSKQKEEKKNLQTALESINKSIQLNCGSFLYYFTRGKIYQKMKNYEKSLEDLNWSIKLKKEDFNEIVLVWKESKKELMKQSYKQVKMPKKLQLKLVLENEEIAKLIQDPFIKHCFRNIKKNPKNLKTYLENEKFKQTCDKILQKLE